MRAMIAGTDQCGNADGREGTKLRGDGKRASAPGKRLEDGSDSSLGSPSDDAGCSQPLLPIQCRSVKSTHCINLLRMELLGSDSRQQRTILSLLRGTRFVADTRPSTLLFPLLSRVSPFSPLSLHYPYTWSLLHLQFPHHSFSI